MNGKYMLVFVTAVILILTGLVGAVDLEKNYIIKNETFCTNNENDVELPQWNTGNKWIYDAQLRLQQSEYFNMDFQLNLNNLEFEIIEIQNNNDFYKVKMTVPQGSLTGNGNIELSIFTFSGSISNAKLNGFLYIKKSTLEMNKCEGTIEGDTNKIILPHFKINFLIEFEKIKDNELVKSNYTALQFPMNINENWDVPLTYLNITTNAIQPNLGEGRLYSYVPEHMNICEKWDIIQTDQTEYDALKIYGEDYGDKSNIWYSPATGNIVKIDYSNLNLGIGYLVKNFQMNLKSTNYQVDSNPPEKPTTPSGGTSFLAGETGTYQTSTTDPDQDKIRYIFDWGDETEQTYSNFINSGETVDITHIWGKDGEHNVKVKARDKYGYESEWSDPLTVTVTNNPPNKPETPYGPTSGNYKDTHDYSTKSTDPDDHQIRYGWDWDGDDDVDQWTDYVDQDTQITTSHKWSSKGTYFIKVKAQDEYGYESEWSDPLSVTMPKSHDFFNHPFLNFLQKINNIYPNIQILNWLIRLLEGKLI